MNKTILISAGHSTIAPIDSGAVGNGFQEAKEALRLRDAVAARLRAKGFEVLEDGADGISEPLKKAIALCAKASVAVEIHFNAGLPKATGIEVLAKPKLKVLSQKLAKAVGDATGLVLRGDKGYKPDNSGQHHRLGFCEAGGAILEVAFISNAEDMRRYKANFEAIAENLAIVLAG
ncbi:MAG TPA: N-acetylmuramoyl-L-alanine amidase [Pyrinomonadaceae bacterium]